MSKVTTGPTLGLRFGSGAGCVGGGTIGRVKIDGHELGEIGLNAGLAASFGAVAVLATSDDLLDREAEAVVPGITTVSVKRSLGNRAADGVASRRVVSANRSHGERCPGNTSRRPRTELRRRYLGLPEGPRILLKCPIFRPGLMSVLP
jgi:hypothetical protein